jgi:hypothetical protein
MSVGFDDHKEKVRTELAEDEPQLAVFLSDSLQRLADWAPFIIQHAARQLDVAHDHLKTD